MPRPRAFYPDRLGLATAASAILLLVCGVDSACAFDFFGLWPGSESPPAVRPDALPYVVTFVISGEVGPPETALRDALSLQTLRKDPPEDGAALARRARRDFGPLVDALWAMGYYDAQVAIEIDGVALPIAASDSPAFDKAAEAYRNHAPVPVQIAVKPGPKFALRNLQILGAGGGALADLPANVVALKAGDPADANGLRAMQARIVDSFRARARPLAKIVKVSAVVDHPGHFMDVTVVVDPGPNAGFGAVAITGPRKFDPLIARSFVYLDEGEPYSPKALAQTKLSLRALPAVGSVRITEAQALDANGNLPIGIDVGERLPHAIGASAQYSTVDGPSGQVYWEDRNLLGGAEYLRLEADVLYAPPNSGPAQHIAGISDADLGGRVAAHFMKPALGDTRNDLLVDAYAERASTNSPGFIGYTVDDADLTVGVRHRFSQYLSMQIGLDTQVGVATDALDTVNYRLIGVPVSLTYDSTDDKLDPTRGFRVTTSFASYPTFLGSSLDLYQAKALASTYYALDADARYVLAGRVHAGSEFGSPLDEIPANLRFTAGGGGSVRGYAYSSLGPMAPGGAVIGGRSVFDGSLELRIRATDTIGFVPFFDAGNAFAGSEPDFSAPLQMAAGLGLRYYTSFGPLRLDVATPINPRPRDSRIAIYASIGQSF